MLYMTDTVDITNYAQRQIQDCCNIQGEAVNYYHKELHRGCCSSPTSASDVDNITTYCVGKNNVTQKKITKGISQMVFTSSKPTFQMVP